MTAGANRRVMTAFGPLLGVAALGLGLAAVGSTIGSPLIVGVALFSVLLVAVPLLASVVLGVARPVDGARK